MKTVTKNLYEGMFLVDSAFAASDWDGVISEITRVLERAEAEIVSIRRWDECHLAYEINHKTRGTYLLSYFKAEGEKIRGVERDSQLSEQIMRVLVLRADHMSQEDIEKETPSMKVERLASEAESRAQAAAEEKIAQAAAAAEAAAEEAKDAAPTEAVEESSEAVKDAAPTEAVKESSEAVEVVEAEKAGEVPVESSEEPEAETDQADEEDTA